MTLEFPNVPAQVLPVLKGQLEAFGAKVHFETPSSGHVDSIAGRLRFSHHGEILTVEVVQEHGHFPGAMLIGGMRQTVEEACELVRLGKAATA
jgi:hypothetical protein